ncbi:major capsid protein P2 [Photobacterium damselae]|uniref:major capsid protein P2 n=1 Tax=Photobacterium damselae TaxID=38293 RepID=UPI000D06590D|nr:major capsid protein P2 [Photobacterium damselae]NVO73220.1 hypothetical protein [Photobacterium damselae subsp. damselae]PSB83000.1 hypothetical protein C5F62_08630 [Photobacterium damselae subsp. damselae]TGZ34025.1 hypothetical protein EQ875_02591 [Photobacterium damselae subsp. damselae]SPY31597.1 Uncharacterised protein [Photobacterium damselae]
MNRNSRVEKMSSFSGVGWNQTATLVIPTGRVYESIILKTNLTAEQLKVARLTLNSEQIYVPTGKDLVAMQKILGQKTKDGFFLIPFADTTMREQGGITCTSLVTEPNDAITLELDLGAKGSHEVPTIEVWAVVSDVVSPRVIVPRWQYQSMQAGAIGTNTFDNLTWAPLRFVRRMLFKSDAITELKIKRDYVEVFKSDLEVNNFMLEQNNMDLFPPTDSFLFDPLARGIVKDYVFPTAHQNQLKFDVECKKQVASIPILVQTFEIVRPEYFKKAK